MPETVTIGQLRWPVTIARRVQTPAGDGSGVAETLRHVLATNAKIAPLGAVSYYGAAAVDTPFTHKIWVRYLDWLDTRHVILRATQTPDGSYRSELFRIRRVGDWEGRKRFSYLEVEEERQVEADLDPAGADTPHSPGVLDLADVSDPGWSADPAGPYLPPIVPGGTGDTAGAYAETITGDGVSASYTVRHGLGTTDVVVEVRDPRDNNARVPGVDDLAPTPDTVMVQFADPLPLGVPLRVVVRR